jgi:hypothetical protein
VTPAAAEPVRVPTNKAVINEDGAGEPWNQLPDLEELKIAESSAPTVQEPLKFAEPPPKPATSVVITPEQQAEPTGNRSLPWPVDVFLYPASISGLATIGVIVVGQLIAPFFCFLSGLIQIVFTFYMYWFFSECVRDSAAAGLRAPETIGSMGSFSDFLWQFLRLFACYCFFFGPVTFYLGYLFFRGCLVM